MSIIWECSSIHVISSLAGGPARILTEVLINSNSDLRTNVVVLSDEYVEKDLLSSLEAGDHDILFCSRKRKLDIRLLLHVRKIIRQGGTQEVVSYDFASNVICALTVWGSKHLWFPSVHGLESAFKWWRAAILRFVFMRASKIIVPSKAVQNKLVDHHISTIDKVSVIPNGISNNCHTRNEEPPKEHFRLVCVANFYSEIKGQKYAVEAMRLLPRNYELSFFGDGIFLTTVKDLAIRYGLEEGIRFLGGLDNRTMREKLVEYDAIVVPSESESFGIVAIEGMAAGLPVIASDVGGLPEVVSKDCGILVAPGDSDALANAIRKVCENPELWKKLHQNGIQHVKKNFTAKGMASKYHELFTRSFTKQNYFSKLFEVLCGLTFISWCCFVLFNYFSQFEKYFKLLLSLY